MKTIVAAALGECGHVAGVSNFLRLAELADWRTIFLGPAVPIEKVLEAVRDERAELVGISYRLTPETSERLIGQFAEEAAELLESGVRFVFGGTPPVAERASKMVFFAKIFDGSESPEQVLAHLKGQSSQGLVESGYPQRATKRIAWRSPFPILRHHFGLPTMEARVEGIQKIAEAQALDFQCADKVFFERFFDVTHVFFGRKPEVKQNKAKLQLVFHANIQHGAHQLVLGYQTGSLPFACFQVTVLQWLSDQLKCHWNGDVSHVIQAVEQVEALHRLALAVIIMPAHHFVFVRIRLFLYGGIKNQDRLFPFDLADGGLDFLPQVFGGVFFIG